MTVVLEFSIVLISPKRNFSETGHVSIIGCKRKGTNGRAGPTSDRSIDGPSQQLTTETDPVSEILCRVAEIQNSSFYVPNRLGAFLLVPDDAETLHFEDT
jgi:hypothetical protein